MIADDWLHGILLKSITKKDVRYRRNKTNVSDLFVFPVCKQEEVNQTGSSLVWDFTHNKEHSILIITMKQYIQCGSKCFTERRICNLRNALTAKWRPEWTWV